MRYLLFIILLTGFFLSCNYSDRAYRTNAEILKSNHLFESFSEKIQFIPKNPIEIYTDTLLTNGFHITLKYKSLENQWISKVVKNADESQTEINYKNFQAQIRCYKNNVLIIEKHIDKTLFNTFETSAFWDKAIMQYVWIDYSKTTKHSVLLNVSFLESSTNNYKDFSLEIYAFGHMKIRETNLVKSIL